MKITLVNNTSGEFPLIGGVPNLGPFAKLVLEITTHTFESLKTHLDSMKSKGLISYSLDSDSTSSPAAVVETVYQPEAQQATKNALQLLRTDIDSNTLDADTKLSRLERDFTAKLSLLEARIELLQKQTSIQNSEPTIFRSEANNAVSMSRQGYEPVNGVTVEAPSTGTWLILVDIGLYSPVASKGQVALGRFGSGDTDKIVEGTERFWSRTQDMPVSVSFSSSLTLAKGDILSIYWKAMEGVLRATYRSITLLKI